MYWMLIYRIGLCFGDTRDLANIRRKQKAFVYVFVVLLYIIIEYIYIYFTR